MKKVYINMSKPKTLKRSATNRNQNKSKTTNLETQR